MSLSLEEIGGSGGKFWNPDSHGDKVTGKVLLVERRQQTSFDDGTPLEWPDGRPRMLTYIEVQTDERLDGDDDGVRALYAKGGDNYEPEKGKGLSMESAIVKAVKDAGEKSIDEGATLTVAYTGDAKPTSRGLRSAKLYLAKYEAPKSSVEVDDLWDE